MSPTQPTGKATEGMVRGEHLIADLDPVADRERQRLIHRHGPAGLAAAVYAATDGLSVVVAERTIAGGQAVHTSRIENYFGVDPAGPPMTGARLSRIGVSQAEAFGAELVPLRAVVDADILDDGRHEVELSTGEKLRGRAVIIASGVDWRRLEVAGIDEFLGRGVFYGAGRSEAPLLGGRHVAVVGAGNSAAQAAVDLALHCDRVTMIVRGRRLSGSLSASLCARIEGDPRIDVRLETEVTAVAGDGRLEAITLIAGEELPADALIVSIGGRPRTHWAAEQNLVIDEGGYLVTGHDLLEHGRPPRSWGLERPPPVTFLDCADVSGDARFELLVGRLWRGPPPLPLCRASAEVAFDLNHVERRSGPDELGLM
jgi:thioredoxin reductase (NADPH)